VLDRKRRKNAECLKEKNTTDKRSVYFVRGSVGMKTTTATAAAVTDDDDDDEALTFNEEPIAMLLRLKVILLALVRLRNMLLLKFIK
jgi:hypothetical protein